MAEDNQRGFFRDVELDELGKLKVNSSGGVMEILLSRLEIMFNELIEEQKITNKLLKKIYNPE